MNNQPLPSLLRRQTGGTRNMVPVFHPTPDPSNPSLHRARPGPLLWSARSSLPQGPTLARSCHCPSDGDAPEV
eukprot:5550370-Lingulodinium_polyedra.AAC.1